MNFLRIIDLAALAAAALLASTPASALTITFGGVNASTGGPTNLTSTYVGAANVPIINPASGTYFFTETFDKPDGGCGWTSPVGDAPGQITVSGPGTLAFRNTNVSGIAAAPSGDTSCYAAAPDATGGLGQTMTIDWSSFLVPYGASINYLGLYWGSIDSYNHFKFYDANGAITIATINGASLGGATTELNGGHVLQFGGNSGDQQDPMTNRYVNFFFSEGEEFTKIEFWSTSMALEFDNVVVGLRVDAPSNVPEPTSLALFGLGLAGLALLRRRKSRAA